MSKTPEGLRSSIWASHKSHFTKRWNNSSSVSLPSVVSAPAASSSIPASTPASAQAVAPTAALGNRLTPAQAFHRFEQACQRLRWKCIDLQMSYHRATNPEEYDFTKADAERNFKVDFHEFYVWIEQAIVLLLLIFGVSISRENYSNGAHAYHHNVLRALEDQDCPVHGALGCGEVIQALWKAKELRNRWKDATEGKETPPLKMYDLPWIVNRVLRGLEEGYHVAGEKLKHARQMEMMEQAQMQDNGMEALDDEWEWMVEPMDWEAA